MAKEQTFAHPPRGHAALLAYDSANDRFQVVHVNVDGELQVYLAGHAGTVLVQQYMPSLLQPGINTYDGAAWRKQPLIWGYTSRLYEVGSHTKSGAGSYTMTLFTVPAGSVYVVNAISSNDTATAIKHSHQVCKVDDCMTIHVETQSAAGVLIVNANISYPMEAGDKLKIVFTAAADADYLIGRVWGYQMSVAM